MHNKKLAITLLMLTTLCSSTVFAELVTTSTKYVTKQHNTSQNTTQQSTLGNISRSSVTPEKVKAAITQFNQRLGKQISVNYDNLCKTQSLNKTQRAGYTKYTQSYKTSLSVAKQTMSFYLEDLDDVVKSTDTAEEKSKAAADIMSRATIDYREAVFLTNDYLKNCSYTMPPLTYQKFLKSFEQNYYLDKLDMTRYTTMK